MGLSLLKMIAVSVVFLYVLANLFLKVEKRFLYVSFIFFAFPFLAIRIAEGYNAFVAISYIYLLFFYKISWPSFFSGWFYRILFFLLIGVIVVGMMVSEFPFSEDSVREFIKLVPLFLFAQSFIVLCLSNDLLLEKMMYYLKYIALFSIVFLVIQMAVGVEFNLTGSIRPNVVIRSGYRYTSILADPQHLSQFFAVLSFLCLLHPEHFNTRQKLPGMLLFFLCIIGIFSSGGRSGLMGFMLGFLIVVFFLKNTYRFSLLLAAALIGVVVLNYKDSFSMFNRGTDLNDTYDFRYNIWMEALQIVRDNPFFGVGIGNYANHVMYHIPNQFWEIDHEIVPFDVPENGYLKIMSECGILGFTLIFLFILYTIAAGFISLIRHTHMNMVYLLASACSFFVSFNGTYTFAEVRICILYSAVISLIIVFLQKSREELLRSQEESEAGEEDFYAA